MKRSYLYATTLALAFGVSTLPASAQPDDPLNPSAKGSAKAGAAATVDKQDKSTSASGKADTSVSGSSSGSTSGSARGKATLDADIDDPSARGEFAPGRLQKEGDEAARDLAPGHQREPGTPAKSFAPGRQPIP